MKTSVSLLQPGSGSRGSTGELQHDGVVVMEKRIEQGFA
jgi:hypothetical protein